MELLKNQYVVSAACYLAIPVSVWAVLSVPNYPHVGMLVVLFAAVLARFIPSRAVKTLCYLLLGFVSYWAAGNALFVPLGQEAQLFSFLPFIILAIANATAAVVAYNDGYLNGTVFVGASLLAILLTKGPLDTGGIDRFLITGFIFTAAGELFVLFASWARGPKWGTYNSLKAAFVAAFIYGIIYVLRVFDISVLNFQRAGEVGTMIAPVFLGIWWASLVANFVTVSLAFAAYELGLYVLGLVRTPQADSVIFTKKGEIVEAEEDPYAALMKRAERFFEEFSRYEPEKASDVLGELESEYSALARKRESPLRPNVGRMLVQARGLLLGARLEVAAAPQPSEAPKARAKTAEAAKMEQFEIPEKSVLLVEGPIGSRKEEFCLNIMKKRIEGKEKCMVVAFEPEMEAGFIGESRLLAQVKVEQNINDMALSISRALEEKPKFVFFNILYYLVPNYNVTTVSGFLASTIKKLKNSGATAVFVMEEEMLSQQALSTLESLFDGVVQFATVDEGGKPHSHYRVKELKFRKFDASWREYG